MGFLNINNPSQPTFNSVQAVAFHLIKFGNWYYTHEVFKSFEIKIHLLYDGMLIRCKEWACKYNYIGDVVCMIASLYNHLSVHACKF